MAARQHAGALIRCGRSGHVLCQAVVATSGKGVAVQLADLRPYAELHASSNTGEVVVRCRGSMKVNGIRRRCRMPWTIQLDDERVVAAVAERSGRGELILGVDL